MIVFLFIYKILKIVYKIKSIKTNYTSNCKKCLLYQSPNLKHIIRFEFIFQQSQKC